MAIDIARAKQNFPLNYPIAIVQLQFVKYQILCILIIEVNNLRINNLLN